MIICVNEQTAGLTRSGSPNAHRRQYSRLIIVRAGPETHARPSPVTAAFLSCCSDPFSDEAMATREHPSDFDVSVERAIGRSVSGRGPLIAIGNPGEAAPDGYAYRTYLNEDEWQAAVADFAARIARQIKKTAAHRGPVGMPCSAIKRTYRLANVRASCGCQLRNFRCPGGRTADANHFGATSLRARVQARPGA